MANHPGWNPIDINVAPASDPDHAYVIPANGFYSGPEIRFHVEFPTLDGHVQQMVVYEDAQRIELLVNNGQYATPLPNGGSYYDFVIKTTGVHNYNFMVIEQDKDDGKWYQDGISSTSNPAVFTYRDFNGNSIVLTNNGKVHP